MNRSTPKPTEDRSRRFFWILFAISLVIFLPFAKNSFFSDDLDVISHLATGGPFGMWTHPPTSFFRPIVASTLWCCYAVGGWHSWVYNFPNYLLNALNAGLVYFVAQAFLRRSNQEIEAGTRAAVSAFAALIFLAAPSNVEAIMFISDRGDLFSALFSMSAVLVFLAALERRQPRLILGVVGLIALGCLSKESIYAMFLFFAAMAIFERGDKVRARIGWLASAGSFAVVLVALTVRSSVVTTALPYGTGSHLGTEAAKGFARVLMMLVRPDIPVDGGIVLGRSVPHLTSTDWLVLAVVLGIVGYGANYLVRTQPSVFKRPNLIAPLAAFMASGLAVCFLAMRPFSPAGGRLMYPPSAYAAIVFAFFLAPYLAKVPIRVLAVGLVMCGALFTFFNGVLYRSVGGVCDATIDWFRTHKPGASDAVILVPDSVGDRYIWRNGFSGALTAFAPDWDASRQVNAAYFDQAAVSALIGGGAIDLGRIQLDAINRTHIAESEQHLKKVNLIVVWENGVVDEIDGVDVDLPKAAPPRKAG